MKLTLKRLREVLIYDPETGIFTRRISRHGNRWKAGTKAGCTRDDGYLVVWIDGALYLGHRLAWFYVHGVWPKEIDHKKGKSCRLSNLRVCDHSQNAHNSQLQRNNTSGLKGANYRKNRGHWWAAIHVRGRQVYLGSFPTAEKAHAAYMQAARQYFGEFANAGASINE